MRAFEDFSPGDRFTTASRALSQDEIIAFAKVWDRQPFHTDPEAAKDSLFNGLCASGFHTLLVTFDLIVETEVWTGASQGSPGMEQVRWLRPVRPGDTLSVMFEVVETRASTSRADRGYVTWDHTTLNQHGAPVMTFRSTGIMKTRAALV